MTEVGQAGRPDSWPMRMAVLHPAWLLVATLLAVICQLAVMSLTPAGIVLAGVCVLVLMWFVLGWTYGIYQVARAVPEQNSIECGPDRGWVFGLAAGSLLLLPSALVDLPPMLDGLRDLVGAVGALSFFASCWLAAAALVTAEGHPVKYPTNKAVGAFLLIVYSVVGAWFIRPRILALLETSRAHDPVRLA